MRTEPAIVSRSISDYYARTWAFGFYVLAAVKLAFDSPSTMTFAIALAFLFTPLAVYMDCWIEDATSRSQARTRTVVAFFISLLLMTAFSYLLSALIQRFDILGHAPKISVADWATVWAIALIPMWGVALFFAECDLKQWLQVQPPPDMTEARAVLEAQSSIPVDLNKLAHNLGLWVSEPYLPDAISGEIVRGRRGKFVLKINGWHSPLQRRLTLAHQIGHFVLHRHLLGDITTDNKSYEAVKNSKITAAHETEATEFAKHLLMPDKFVDRLRSEGLDLYLMAHQFDVAPDMMRARLGIT